MGTGNSWYTAVMPFFSTPSHIVQYRVSSQSPLAIAPFYVSTWEEYHTGVLQLGFINGPTEGILSATAILLASAVLTPFIWMQPLHVSVPAIASYFPVYVTLADVLCCIMGLLVIFVQIPQRYELTFRLTQILTSPKHSTWTVHSYYAKQNKSSAKAFAGLIPIVAFYIAYFGWLSAPGSTARSHHIIPFILAMGIAFGRNAVRNLNRHFSCSHTPP